MEMSTYIAQSYLIISGCVGVIALVWKGLSWFDEEDPYEKYD